MARSAGATAFDQTIYVKDLPGGDEPDFSEEEDDLPEGEEPFFSEEDEIPEQGQPKAIEVPELTIEQAKQMQMSLVPSPH